MTQKAIIKVSGNINAAEAARISLHWKRFIQSDQPEALAISAGIEIIIGDFLMIDDEPVIVLPNGEVLKLSAKESTA